MDPEHIELDVLPDPAVTGETNTQEPTQVPVEPMEQNQDVVEPQTEVEMEVEGEGEVVEDGSEYDEEQGKLLSKESMKELAPWLMLSGVGVTLLLVAVILFCTGTGPPRMELDPLKIPAYQGSIKINSVDGEMLKFDKHLKYIGSMESRELRRMVEPKLIDIYEEAGLMEVEVVVLAFKYGGAGTTMNSTKPMGRLASNMGSDGGIVIRHWVYTSKNSTMSNVDLLENVKQAATTEPDVMIDMESIQLLPLDNMTLAQAALVLSQHGFFKHGIQHLDLTLLNKLGLVRGPENLGVQSDEDDGVCPPLTTPLHTTLSPTSCRDSSSTYLGMACTFECTGGRYMEGSATRVCLSTGQWSGSPAVCKTKCPAIHLATSGSLLPGSCSHDQSNEGQLCFVQCPNSHQLYSDTTAASGFASNSLFRECQTGGWSGDVGFCKARCPALEAPMYSSVMPSQCTSNPQGGDICTLECNAGYVLDGGGSTQQVTCGLDGQWNYELLHCKKTCPVIVVGANQMVEPSTCSQHPYEGETCMLGCAAGYTISGVSNRVCLSGGTWDSVQATCVPACSTLSSIANGVVTSVQGSCFTNNPPEGTKCSLVCDSGYTPSADYTTCDSNGDWTVPNIMCIRACPLLSSPSSGSWSPSSCSLSGHHTPSADCTLSCNAPYNVVGSSTITCDSNTGEWSNMPGHCAVTCNALSAPTNGGVTSTCTTSTMVGTSCIYTCDAGYTLTGTKQVSCLDTGLWSAVQPSCGVETQYVIKQTSSSGVAVCLHVNENNMLMKKYAADCTKNTEGNRWALVAPTNIVNVYSKECLTTSTTDDAKLEMATCNVADPTQHFMSEFQFKIQSNNGRYISSGYRSSDIPQLTLAEARLNMDSDWQLEDMAGADTTLYGARNADGCKAYQLSSDDMSSTCSAGPQAAAFACTVSCDAGYQLTIPAQSNIQCLSGSWDTGADLMCLSTTQPSTSCHAYDATLISGATLSPATCTSARSNAGDSCTATCTDAQHYIDGPSSLTCLTNGKWSSYQPTVCKPHCSAISVPMNTMLLGPSSECTSGTAVSGTVCPFGCPDGYALVGKHMLTCLDGGKWDNAVPMCKKICPTVNSEALTISGCATDDGLYLEGSVCSLSCATGYTLSVPSNTMACTDAGTWQVDEPVECVKACPSFPSTLTSTPSACSSGPSTPGTMCTLSCATGSLVVGNEVVASVDRICDDDRMWQGPFAYCINSCPPLTTEDAATSGYYEPSTCSSGAQPPGTRCQLMCQGQNKVTGGGAWHMCANNGTWLPDVTHSNLGSCAPTCQPLPKPQGGSVTPQTCLDGNVQLGTECVISCPPHMDRVGSGIRKCMGTDEVGADEGGWSGEADSRCVARCPPLTLDPNNFVFPRECEYSSMVEGQHCVFECHKGLALIGASTLTCTEKGEWDHVMPQCQHACPALDVTNGEIFCSTESAQPIAELGYVHEVGTKCLFVCDQGYTTLTPNEITCLPTGVWSPIPYCRVVEDVFSILQKIEDNTKCLVSQMTNMAYVLNYVHSTEDCEAAGNNAMWLWHGDYNIQHAQTGLCLAAQIDRVESFIELSDCDINNQLQHWDCDVNKPYRILLKNTVLGIDSTYDGLGPILTKWTHANSYWVTFNSELETTASICSFKASGACPGITIPGITATPAVCMSSNVQIWQKCAMTCADGTYMTGVGSTECSPTGVWKNIESVRCAKKCPPLVASGGKQFTPARCTGQNMDELSTCKMTCLVGNKLSNGENEVSMVCEDGAWTGGGVNCMADCVTTPPAPLHGSVACNQGTCTVSCNPGYALSGSKTIACVDGSFSASTGTCTAELQFKIQSSTTDQCVAVTGGGDVPMTTKVTCDKNNKNQYWKWSNGMLKHINTGMCLNASSTGNWDSATAATCNMDDSQLFKCGSNPYNVVLTSAVTYRLDLGNALGNSPVVSTNGIQTASNNWVGVDQNDLTGTLCSFKTSATCSGLVVGPAASVTSQCALDSVVGSECTVTCNAGYTLVPAANTLTCLTSGIWDNAVPSCVANLPSEGTCNPFVLTVGLAVTPPQCSADVVLNRGTLCMFSCLPGYYMTQGTPSAYCTGVTNLWTGTVPQCKPFCLGLPPTPTTYFTPATCGALQVTSGTTCTSTCAQGSVTSAGITTNARTCADDGTWSGMDEPCMVGCTLQGATTDGSLVTNGSKMAISSLSCVSDVQAPGTSCTLTCPANYVLVDGEATMKCMDGGEWDGPMPRCIPAFKCPQVSSLGAEPVEYEPMMGTAIVAGTTATLTCLPGYTISGDSTRICMSNGTWGGSGGATSVCKQLCEPILPKFLSVFSPSSCTDQYSEHGDTCTMTCGDNVALSNGDWSISITCQNGVWSGPLPSCVADPLTPLNVYETNSDFMMINIASAIGCFTIGSDNALKWMPRSDCKPEDDANRWRMTGNSIKNKKNNLCLQPINIVGSQAVLGVGTCIQDNVQQLFMCGNPDSSNQRFSLFSASTTPWRMFLQNDPTTYLPSYVAMETVPANQMNLNRELFETLSVTANANMGNPQHSDKPVCSYSCGGLITDETSSGYIVSPGYLGNGSYLPNTECVWILASNKKITLTLLELDLESNIGEDADYVKVYEGSSDNVVYSEHLRTYHGRDISMYDTNNGGHVTSSINMNMLVKFRSNGMEENGGFVMSYKFETPIVPSQCGMSSYVWPTVDPITELETSAMAHTAEDGKWPWVVSIRETAERSGHAYPRCTGVLVDATTILSAAHCAKFALVALSRDGGVSIGVNRVSQFHMNDDLTNGNGVYVDRLFIHPNYDDTTRTHNIAVWKLTTPIMYTDTQPACLPIYGHNVHNTDSECFAVGWTQIDKGTSSHNMLDYKMKMETSAWCEQDLGLEEDSGFVCANHVRLDASGYGGTDDSEPLLCKRQDHWYVVGVASHTQIGSRSTRRLYTSVHSHGQWLQQALSMTSQTSYKSLGLDRLASEDLDTSEIDQIAKENWLNEY
ncbi:sushi, von Willebrand factor type A, EGF and pentraxin domain-containing protein 1 [Ciona intestinalis]